MLKQRLHRYLAIVDESGHLIGLVSLGHVGYMYAAAGVGRLLQGDIGHGGDGIGLSNQNVL